MMANHPNRGRKQGRVTFGKSEPWHGGWRGWSDSIDILVDGEKVGQLVARDCDQRRHMDYGVQSELPELQKITWVGMGLRDIKKKVRAAITSARD